MAFAFWYYELKSQLMPPHIGNIYLLLPQAIEVAEAELRVRLVQRTAETLALVVSTDLNVSTVTPKLD